MESWHTFKFIHKLLFLAAAVLLSSLIGIYLAAFLAGPPQITGKEPTVLLDRNGERIAEYHGVAGAWTPLPDLPEEFVQTTLLIEDRHFYGHHGFDFKRMAGAMIRNLQSGSLKEGASTITQQYARNLYLSPEKTWTRKLKEAFYTIRLEIFYSKEEILEGYLNTIYFGHGAYGTDAASNHFFGKSPDELSAAETAMLVGIPKGPTYYSPFNNEEKAVSRQRLIMELMLEQGVIDETEYELASAEKLLYKSATTDVAISSHFKDQVLKETAALLETDPQEIKTAGLTIRTTLDSELQEKFEAATKSSIGEESQIEAAGIALSPATGEIRAMIGGRDYSKSSYNRAIDARRMTGSTFKPILYYAALESGYTASTSLLSRPTEFELADGQIYQPSNYNGYYADEAITLAQAIALSDNIYAVKTNLYLGPEKLAETAGMFGIGGSLPEVPSLALGTASVSVDEMTAAYGMLANGGDKIDTFTVQHITDADGKEVYRRKIQQKNVLDAGNAFILTQLMTGMFDEELNGYTAVTGLGISHDLSRIYAGKSGTTNTDSWMIGYSPSLVTGVWIGYDDNRKMEIAAEESYAKNIWAAFMESAHEGQPAEIFPMPEGVVGVPIDPQTGKKATVHCNRSRMMFFKKGTEPDSFCNGHHMEEPHHLENGRGVFERVFDIFF